MKDVRCIACGKKLDAEQHDFDKDGYPICHDCWTIEDEKLKKEMK